MKRAKLKLKIGAPNGALNCSLETRYQRCDPGINLLKQGIIEGENPVFDSEFAAYDPCSKSRVVWDCSSNWVVNFI